MTRVSATSFDDRLYDLLCQTADAGRACPNTEDLCDYLGCESNSTPSEVMGRLERRGLIKVTRYQRHRVVQIVASGRSTKAPANAQVHWRDRPLGMAAGALKLAEIAQPGAADAIRGLSLKKGLLVPDLVADIMRRGLLDVQTEAGSQCCFCRGADEILLSPDST